MNHAKLSLEQWSDELTLLFNKYVKWYQYRQLSNRALLDMIYNESDKSKNEIEEVKYNALKHVFESKLKEIDAFKH